MYLVVCYETSRVFKAVAYGAVARESESVFEQ